MDEKQTKTYYAKSLFSGRSIGKEPSTKYVAVPDMFKDYRISVSHDGKIMTIEDWNAAEAYRVFPDKYDRNRNYTLGYFKFKED